jgi:hypothetical protein
LASRSPTTITFVVVGKKKFTLEAGPLCDFIEEIGFSHIEALQIEPLVVLNLSKIVFKNVCVYGAEHLMNCCSSKVFEAETTIFLTMPFNSRFFSLQKGDRIEKILFKECFLNGKLFDLRDIQCFLLPSVSMSYCGSLLSDMSRK